MARGRLDPPNLDDRTWQQLVDQAKALIPAYAPEWTDHNPSDLGITLIELFAWMVEQLIYRLNRVPDKTYIHLLNLLDITRDPATPSSTLLTFVNTSGSAVQIAKGDQFATRQTESDAAVVFEVDKDLAVQPINLVAALGLYPVNGAGELSYENYGSKIVGDADHPPSSTRIAIPNNAKVTLALGFAGNSQTTIRLRIKATRSSKGNTNLKVTWTFSASGGTSWPGTQLDKVIDETKGFTNDGIVQMVVPDTWAVQKPKDWTNVTPKIGSTPVNEELRWIGVEFANNGDEIVEIDLGYILFETNSVWATNALSIERSEELGISTGKPFQAFEFASRPLYKEPGRADPYHHVKIMIKKPSNGGSGELEDSQWTQKDDMPPGKGQHYRLNPVTGTVYFGNYTDEATTPHGHGLIPPKGSTILTTYRYVAGGANGNVPAGTVKEFRRLQKAVSGLNVTNLVPATGGSDEETIEETKARAPQALRTRDQAVTIRDFEYMAREAGSTKVARVRCLPPRVWTDDDYDNGLIPSGKNKNDPWHYGGIERSAGNVNLIVVEPSTEDKPQLSDSLRREIESSLLSRRLVTTKIKVEGPKYVKINVTVSLIIWPKVLEVDGTSSNSIEKIKKEYEDKYAQDIKKFLHPLTGGIDGHGWEIGQDFLTAQLLQAMRIPPEVGYITDIVLGADPDYVTNGENPEIRPYPPSSQEKYRIALADFELICAGVVTVNATRGKGDKPNG